MNNEMTTDNDIDDAYAEKAERDERAEQAGHREHLTDLSEPGALAGLPHASAEKVPTGSGCDVPAWDLGDNHGSSADRSDSRTGKYRPVQGVTDMESAGHGFSVQRFSNPDLPEYCRFCGNRLIPPAIEWPCELTLPMGATFTDINSASPMVPDKSPKRECRCNGCEIRRIGVRKRGGQPRQCGAPECAKQYNKVRQKIYRDRSDNRDRQRAMEVVRLEPWRTDKDIADQLGIKRPKRVKEARQNLATKGVTVNA